MSSPEPDKVMFPSSRKCVELHKGEGFAWFLDTLPPANMKYTPFNTNWKGALRAISVCELNVSGRPPYYIWSIRDMQALIQLMKNINPSSATFIRLMIELRKPLQQIVVCAAGAGPFGEYFFNMINRTARFDALLVMFWGHRNAAPCSCCAKRYAGTVCEFVGRQGDKGLAHVNYPFLYCVSHPSIQSGKCANCIYHVTPECEYNSNNDKFKNYQCIQKRAARVDTSPMRPVRRMWDGAPLNVAYNWEAIMKKKKACQEKQYAPDEEGDDVGGD